MGLCLQGASAAPDGPSFLPRDGRAAHCLARLRHGRTAGHTVRARRRPPAPAHARRDRCGGRECGLSARGDAAVTHRRRPRWVFGAVVLLAALALQVLGANPAVSQTAEVTVWGARDDPGLDPGAPVWSQIAPLEVPLSAQGMTYPQGTLSVPTLGVRAVMHQRALY